MRWKAWTLICLSVICATLSSAATTDDSDPICWIDPATGEEKCVDGPDPVGIIVDEPDPMGQILDDGTPWNREVIRTHDGKTVILEPTDEMTRCARDPEACTLRVGAEQYGACDATRDCRVEIDYVCTDRGSRRRTGSTVTVSENGDGSGSCSGTCADGHTVLILCPRQIVRPTGRR